MRCVYLKFYLFTKWHRVMRNFKCQVNKRGVMVRSSWGFVYSGSHLRGKMYMKTWDCNWCLLSVPIEVKLLLSENRPLALCVCITHPPKGSLLGKGGQIQSWSYLQVHKSHILETLQVHSINVYYKPGGNRDVFLIWIVWILEHAASVRYQHVWYWCRCPLYGIPVA